MRNGVETLPRRSPAHAPGLTLICICGSPSVGIGDPGRTSSASSRWPSPRSRSRDTMTTGLW